MRVVINQSTTLGQKAGIGHYTEQLVRHLRHLCPEDRIDTFPIGWVRTAADLYSQTRTWFYAGAQPTAGRQGRFDRWRRAGLTRLYGAGQRLVRWHFRDCCRRQAYDLYHEPNMIPLPSDRQTLATFHDLSLLLHPEWHSAERVVHFERQLPRALRQCSHIVTDCDFIRRQVMKVLNVPSERVTRVYLGIRDGLEPLPSEQVAPTLARLGLPPRYLLSVGTIEPRKNLLPLLRAYCDLPGALRERWPLVLIGRWGWNTEGVAKYLDDVARHRGVMHLGYLPDDALPAVYNGARALIYPSLYEGFGLPPLEMMACGGAVLASTADALVETIGTQAHLVEPEDIAGWRNALERVLMDDEWWQSLRNGSTDVARPFTWEQCAAETLAVYRQLCREVPEECVFARTANEG